MLYEELRINSDEIRLKKQMLQAEKLLKLLFPHFFILFPMVSYNILLRAFYYAIHCFDYFLIDHDKFTTFIHSKHSGHRQTFLQRTMQVFKFMVYSLSTFTHKFNYEKQVMKLLTGLEWFYFRIFHFELTLLILRGDKHVHIANVWSVPRTLLFFITVSLIALHRI